MMHCSNWIGLSEKDNSEGESYILKAIFDFCGQMDVPLAIFSDEGKLLMINQNFKKKFDKDLKWEETLIKEIFIMRTLNKVNVDLEYNNVVDGNENFYEFSMTKLSENDQFIFICKASEITKDRLIENRILDMNYQLTQKIKEINEAQIKIMNQEKLVGIGQLAAGVAHEINNPLGFVKSNFRVLDDYFQEITKLLILVEENIKNFKLGGSHSTELDSLIHSIENAIEQSEYQFILEDYQGLINDTSIGLERVEKIVMSLRKFSRVDHMMTFTEYALNEGIDETLIIANNEIKYNAEVIKDMQYVPLTYAIAGEINQVLLNILINATHAIKEKGKNHKGIIKITTRSDEKYIYCEIIDNGIGIKMKDQDKIFLPFFTTKEVGNGTGLGMSIAYDIITNKHNGEISFISEYGIGSTFKIKLPIRRVDTETVDSFINT